MAAQYCMSRKCPYCGEVKYVMVSVMNIQEPDLNCHCEHESRYNRNGANKELKGVMKYLDKYLKWRLQ